MSNYSKRLLKEKQENANGNPHFYIQPLQDDLYKWHFTIRGVEGTPYEGGIYHGYFDLPYDYPMSPPNIYFLNQSGRYQINKKICMSITSYHKEEWTPAWTLQTMLRAVLAHFSVEDKGIGSITENSTKRKQLAKESVNYHCQKCGSIQSIADKFIKQLIFKKIY